MESTPSLPCQKSQILLEPRRRRQSHLAAKHRRDAAKGATKAAAERRLIARRALPEIGLGQILLRILQTVVRQHAGEACSGKHTVLVMHDPIVRAPREAGDRGKRLMAAVSERIQKLDKRILALGSDSEVDVRRVQGRIRTHRRKSSAPDDRHAGRFRADRLRDRDCRCQLRAAHDADADGVNAAIIDCPHRGGDKVAIDIAVDDPRRACRRALSTSLAPRAGSVRGAAR